MTVLLVGPREDAQLAAVRSALDQRGVSSEVLDTGCFPEAGTVSYRQSGVDSRVRWNDVSLDDTSAVRSVFVRGLGLDPRVADDSGALERRPISYLNQLREYRALLSSMLHELLADDVPMINEHRQSVLDVAKPFQHRRFAAAGLPVPESLATSDPAALKAFVEDVEDVIYKPVAGGGYATELSESDLTPNRLEKLSNSPVLFQQQVEGENLRLYVLDGEVIASICIDSEQLDYRTGEHTIETRDVDERIANAAITAAEAVDLRFAGVDIIADSDGDEFAVLEANSSPMFASIENRAGTDIAGQLARGLCRPSTDE